MSDLIRREEVARAVRLLSEVFIDGGSPTAAAVLNIAMDHINALPAVQPDADELVGHMTKLIAAGLDRIEQLTAERDRYRKALDETAQILSQCTFETIRVHGQYIDRREAVSRARAALKEINP